VSDLNNDTPISDNPVENEEQTSSRVMLTTMLLLIAGFILTGTMMLHYAKPQFPATDIAAAESGQPTPPLTFNFASWLDKLKPEARSENRMETAAAGSTTTNAASVEAKQKNDVSGIAKLFGGGDEVRWPKLKLTGFGSSSDGSGGFAIINGDQVHPGELINGKVELIKVRTQDVIVQYMGETKTLTVDLQQ